MHFSLNIIIDDWKWWKADNVQRNLKLMSKTDTVHQPSFAVECRKIHHREPKAWAACPWSPPYSSHSKASGGAGQAVLPTFSFQNVISVGLEWNLCFGWDPTSQLRLAMQTYVICKVSQSLTISILGDKMIDMDYDLHLMSMIISLHYSDCWQYKSTVLFFIFIMIHRLVACPLNGQGAGVIYRLSWLSESGPSRHH